MPKLITTTAAALLCAIFLLGAIAGSRAQKAQTAAPEPSPTPIDQKWQVYHGDIESLEDKLHELNSKQVFVQSDQITLSQDGKRFVILLNADPPCEDCDGK